MKLYFSEKKNNFIEILCSILRRLSIYLLTFFFYNSLRISYLSKYWKTENKSPILPRKIDIYRNVNTILMDFIEFLFKFFSIREWFFFYEFIEKTAMIYVLPSKILLLSFYLMFKMFLQIFVTACFCNFLFSFSSENFF